MKRLLISLIALSLAGPALATLDNKGRTTTRPTNEITDKNYVTLAAGSTAYVKSAGLASGTIYKVDIGSMPAVTSAGLASGTMYKVDVGSLPPILGVCNNGSGTVLLVSILGATLVIPSNVNYFTLDTDMLFSATTVVDGDMVSLDNTANGSAMFQFGVWPGVSGVVAGRRQYVQNNLNIGPNGLTIYLQTQGGTVVVRASWQKTQ